ncbi:MAG: hypothetical protein NVSMB67_17850 [Flavisolibacter sp.]
MRADNKDIINDKGPIILRAIGLGGWMLQEPYMLHFSGIANSQHEIRSKIEGIIGRKNAEKFYKAWRANYISRADIKALSSWGFNAIRLPLHFNLFTLPLEAEPVQGRDTWLENGFRLTDSLLNWCEQYHIYLVLDLHATPGGQGNDVSISDRDGNKPSLWQLAANQQKTINLWVKLAARYANRQWIGGYDLINETNWGFENLTDKNGCAETQNLPLKQLLTDITTAIRKVDQNHLIFLEANCWANNYKGILPSWDKNMAVSFHKYWNFNNQNSIQSFLDIRDKYNIPIWLGESGENSNAWFTDAIDLMEKNRIGWAWWPLKKMGINNPLEIKLTTQFSELVKFFKGEGSKPPPSQAFKILMEVASNTNFKNNRIHKDVLDAMFRQVHSTQSLPFMENQVRDHTIIFAVDYDLGKSGYAYHDKDSADYHVSTGHKTPWNKGHQYRNDGVDIDLCTDSLSNGFKVFSFEEGEWLHYSITVLKSGNYSITLRARTNVGEGVVKINFSNGEEQLISFPSKDSWQSLTLKSIYFKKGQHFIRIEAVTNNMELNYFQFKSSK